MTKTEIREKMKHLRAAIGQEDREKKSLAAEERVIGSRVYKNARVIMLYSPLKSETDTAVIAKAALADGKQVVYPVTDESGRIVPVEVSADTEFKRGGFGIYEPCGDAYEGPIDLVILPGVAFDREGGRLGFGKGCYDALLADIDAYKIGLCYEVQLTDELPMEEHDVRMDMIVTECETIEIKKNA